MLSAPMTIAGAIAARTDRIKIGIAVQVLPLCHPLRIAEEAATVDQISHGRLIFGIGRSGVAANLRGLRHPLRGEPRALCRDVCDIIKQAWIAAAIFAPRQVSQLRQCRGDAETLPKAAAAEIRIAASTPDTFPAIGKLGYPIFVDAASGTLSELAAHRGLSRSLPGGRPSRARPGLSAGAGLCRRDRASGRAPRPRRASCISSASRRSWSPGFGAPRRRQNGDRGPRRARCARSVTYDDALRGKIIVGTPGRRRRQARRRCARRSGFDGILAELNCGGMIPQDRVVNALRLMCQEVKPRFH